MGLVLPFDQGISNSEEQFWVMVLRAGRMDVEQAFKVLMNYFGLLKNNSKYIASSHPPTGLDLVFQQQVTIPLIIWIFCYNHLYILKVHRILQHRDSNGRRVAILRPGKWEPDNVHLNDAFCGGYAIAELVARETK